MSEEIVKQVSRMLFHKPYTRLDEIQSVTEGQEKKILEEIHRRMDRVGLSLGIVESDGIDYVVLTIPDTTPDFPMESIGVLAAVAGVLKLRGGALSKIETEQLFRSVRTRLNELERKDFVRYDSNDNLRMTPLGVAILKNAYTDIGKIVEEAAKEKA